MEVLKVGIGDMKKINRLKRGKNSFYWLLLTGNETQVIYSLRYNL